MEKTQSRQTSNSPRSTAAARNLQEAEIHPIDDALCYLKTYARQKPEMAALWCLGVGFVLGWKLKPW